MTDTAPLSGLRIAVTRPKAQAEGLAREIEKLGGTAIRFPLLEIAPPDNPVPLQTILARLAEFEIVIFISPNAVHYGLQAMQACNRSFGKQLIAAIGSGTAAALHENGIASVLTSDGGADSDALLRLPELQQVAGCHILIFRGDHGRELLGDTLKQRGASVEYAPCYCRRKPQQDIVKLLQANPDILTISSSEALRNLHEMLPQAQLPRYFKLPLFVIHERIAVAARALGWQNTFTVNDGDEGLLTAISRWAADNEDDHE